MSELFGEVAGLSTAFCWAFTSIFFTIGGSRVGSVVVNRTRLVLAIVYLSLTHLAIYGSLFPWQAGTAHFLWLSLSAIAGLVIGDSMLFQSYLIIGTRLAMLLMSLVPVISTALAWVFLGEKLSATELTGVIVTVSGIAWVVADKQREKSNGGVHGRKLAWGILLGSGGAVGQSFGLLTSKIGLAGNFPALSGNLIRMATAAVVMWMFAVLSGKAKDSILKLRDTKARKAILGGSLTGPFLGVWLSLVAIKYARIGIASTLMGLTPIIF